MDLGPKMGGGLVGSDGAAGLDLELEKREGRREKA